MVGALGQVSLRLPHWILIESGWAHLSTTIGRSSDGVAWTAHPKYFLLLLLQLVLVLLHEVRSLHVPCVARRALSRHLVLLPLRRVQHTAQLAVATVRTACHILVTTLVHRHLGVEVGTLSHTLLIHALPLLIGKAQVVLVEGAGLLRGVRLVVGNASMTGPSYVFEGALDIL